MDLNKIETSLRSKGVILSQGSDEYNESRSVFNGYVRSRPAVIIRPKCVEDIQSAIILARHRGIQITIKNGGHSAYGFSVREGCMVLDMQAFKDIQLDSKKETITVGAGVLSGELDRVLAPYTLAVPLGDCGGVGVAGLALGGGNGFLSKKHGLTCDSILECSMVDYRGRHVQIGVNSNEEILWAMRGAGQNNFGVVTSITFRVLRVPDKLVTGSIFLSLDSAPHVFQKFVAMMNDAPEELSLFIRINREYNGQPGIRIYGIFLGEVNEGLGYFQEIETWTKVLFSDVRVRSYYEAQQINTSSISKDVSFHWKSAMIKKELDADFCQQLVECFYNCPNEYGRLNLDPLGGAIARMPRDKSAFSHRDMKYILSIIGVWNDPDDHLKYMNWVISTADKLKDHCHLTSRYQNYVDPESSAADYYGANLLQLQQLKGEWDPHNLFFGLLTHR